MSTSKTILHNELRNAVMGKVSDFLREQGEEILVVGSNELAFPCVDSEGNDEFVVVTFKVPTGSRDDGLPYDGYAMAEAYALKQKDKAEKAAVAAEKKAAKIARDKAEREAKAKAKAQREAEGQK